MMCASIKVIPSQPRSLLRHNHVIMTSSLLFCYVDVRGDRATSLGVSGERVGEGETEDSPRTRRQLRTGRHRLPARERGACDACVCVTSTKRKIGVILYVVLDSE